MLISTRCIRGFMSSLIKKSWKDSISDPRSLQVNYVRGRNSELMMRTNHLCHQLLPMYLHNTYYELPCRKKKLFVTRWQFPLQLALKHTAANCFANWIKHLEPRPFWLAATSRESLQEVNDKRVVFKGIEVDRCKKCRMYQATMNPLVFNKSMYWTCLWFFRTFPSYPMIFM